MSDTPRKRRFMSPLNGSLLIHSVLLGALLHWGMGRVQMGDGPDNASSGSASGGSTGETSVAEDLEDAASKITQRIDRGLDEGASTPIVEHVRKANANATWLEDNSSEEAVSQIAERVRKAYNTPDRAYAPVTPPPAGAFDYRSMLPYSSKRQTDADGVERTYQTWVDRDGRTMMQTRRRITDSDGKTWLMQGMVQADGTVYETKMEDDESGFDSALETASRSSLIQKLFSEAVLPVLEAKRKLDEPKP